MDSIKSLDLSYASVRDSHIGRLASLPFLEELHLDSCPMGDSALAHLADHDVVPNLTCLDLSDTNMTDAGLVHIAKFQRLTRLSLFYCNVSNRSMRHLAQLKELQVLNLDSRDISDEGLLHLRDLPKLECLDIFSGRITDPGCVHISRIKTLRSLELCGGGIGDAGCIVLASLPELLHLNLSQNEGITNRGAAALAATLIKMRTLNLSNTSVSSSAFRYFTGLTQLESLALYGCRGMEYPMRIQWLKHRIPSLKCLRLNHTSAEEGTVLVDVSEESSSDDEIWSTELDDVMSNILSDYQVNSNRD
jgi:hypothetical protein